MQLATGGGCFSASLCGTLMFTDDTDTMLPVAFQKHKRRYLHSSLTLIHRLDSIWQGHGVTLLRIRHVIVYEIMNVGWLAMLRLHRHQACLKKAAQCRDKEAGSILLYCFFKAKPKPKIRFVQQLKINREVDLTAIDIGLDLFLIRH